MKQTFISASIVAMLSSGAIAGNTDLAIADPVITPPPTSTVTDWSGGYVGLSYSSVEGTMEYSTGPVAYEYEDSAIGVFAGYNWQRSNLVYGGELNVSAGSLDLAGFNEKLDTRIELRGRVGYAMGDALVYGFFGYGMSEFGKPGVPDAWDVDGVTYGVGVDYMITNTIFAGLEFSHRELKGNATTPQSIQTSSIDMISLRIGYNY